MTNEDDELKEWFEQVENEQSEELKEFWRAAEDEYDAGCKKGEIPVAYVTYDLDGDLILVSAIKYLGNSRWLCINEDGDEIICNGKDLFNPHF